MNLIKKIIFIFIFPCIIFAQNNNLNEVRFIAAGDLNVAHWITPLLEKDGYDFPFKYLKGILRNSDLVFANLEAPFCHNGTPLPKNFVFKVPEKHVKVLKSGKINLVSLANNHILDYGYDCLSQTIQVLKKENINFAGAGNDYRAAHQPAIFKINDISFAFFAYSMTLPKYFFASDSTGGTAYPNKKIFKDSISYYNDIVDYIIVSFHWGEELKTNPKEYQINTAHKAIDYGADIILGHHPHVLQGIEIYKNKLIVYSFGNFIFASYSRKAADSILLDLIFTKTKINSVRILPINVNNYEINFAPRLLQDKKKSDIIRHMQLISEGLNENKQIITKDGFLSIE